MLRRTKPVVCSIKPAEPSTAEPPARAAKQKFHLINLTS